MNIHSVDLNLFLVFEAVYVTRSVTLAGARLNMTQSAVSNALKRARERFNDPLFVKTSGGMVPTALAERLIGPVEDGLRHFAQAIHEGRRFDPQASERTFTIALNDTGQLVLLDRLLTEARRIAPGVRIEAVDIPIIECRDRMMKGQVDIAVGGWDPLGDTFIRQRLYSEPWVVVLRTGHALVRRGGIAFSDYMDAEHVVYRPNGMSDHALQQGLDDVGNAGRRRVVLTVAHSPGLAPVIAKSSLLLTVPSCVAQRLAASCPDLAIVPMRFDTRSFEVSQQWHERFQPDGGSRWLRELVFGIFHRVAGADPDRQPLITSDEAGHHA